jgi:phospholipase/carboxylesterase
MAQSTIDGPRLDAPSGKAKQLIVILHGYGADGKDLITIGKEWQKVLPDAACIAPNAHQACDQSPMGRQWFSLSDRNPNERWTGACSASPVIDDFLDTELAKLGLTDKDLALVGFSQGAMMALHTGLRRKQAPAGILSFSGLLVGPEHLAETVTHTAATAPPIFMLHGSADGVVPVQSMFMSANALAEVGIPSQWHLTVGLEHNIDAQEITYGALYLSNCFGLPYPAQLRRG